MNFNEKLQKLRKEQKLSQEELADKLDVTRQSVSKWESGQTYPEMDKLLAICKIFNCSLEELTNDDIKLDEFNKETKINIINYILDYIKRVFNYFSHITFKEFIKLFLTMLIVHIVLSLLHYPFVELENIIRESLSFLKESFFTHLINGISNFIIDVVYSFGCIFLFFYIFTIGFLDKKEIIEEETITEEDSKEEKIKEVVKNKTIVKTVNKTESKLIEGIGLIFMLFIKFILLCCVAPFVMIIVFLSFCLAIDISLLFQGVFSFGVTLGLICAISFFALVIEFFTNIILNHKHNGKRMVIVLLASLIGGGIASGILTMETTKYEFIEGTPTSLKVKTDTYDYTYYKGLYINSYYGYTSHEDNTMKDNEIRIEIINYDFKDHLYLVEDKENTVINIERTSKESYKLNDYYKLIIDSLKEKKIYTFYDNPESRFIVYANKETLKKLDDNLNEIRKIKEQDKLNSRIDELKSQNREYEEQISKLEDEKRELEQEKENLQNKVEDYKTKIESLMD